MTAASELIPPYRAQKAVDSVLPEHTYEGPVSGQRFWTNSRGSFRVEIVGDHPGKRFVFHDERAGWRVEVPMTAPGLHALVIAMVLAGALTPGAITQDGVLGAVAHLGRERSSWPASGWLT